MYNGVNCNVVEVNVFTNLKEKSFVVIVKTRKYTITKKSKVNEKILIEKLVVCSESI